MAAIGAGEIWSDGFIPEPSFRAFERITLLDSLYIQPVLGDQNTRMIGWETLKEKAVFGELAIVGPLNISLMMRQIEQEISKEGPLLTHVEKLFQRFAERLSPYFQEAEIPAEVQAVSELQLIKLQAALKSHYEDEGLETIWNLRLLPIFIGQGAFAGIAAPVGPAAIREWLNDPANAEWIQGIRALDLRGLNLKALFSEIGLFTGLISLNLSRNQLSSLPEAIGNLTKLLTLDLFSNQLSTLPESIGDLRELTGLWLESNQLIALPKTIGNLRDVIFLNLSNNQLSTLPETFGKLRRLRAFSIDNNQLRALPDMVGNLRSLTEFSISNNQLSTFPEAIGNLKGLRKFSFVGNPLILFSDKEAVSITDSQTYAAHLTKLKKYAPLSPLAILFRTISLNQPIETIQQAYRHLSVEMQQRITAMVAQETMLDHQTALSSSVSDASSSSASSSIESSIDLFDDMSLFARSVRRSAYGLYDSLGQDQKDLVHHHIWDLAGRPETDDPDWGKNHVFDHVLRFTDALELAIR